MSVLPTEEGQRCRRLFGQAERDHLADDDAVIAAKIKQAIKSNTQLLNSFGAEAVPFIVARNAKTGQTVSRDGAMSTPALAEFLGVEAP